MNRRIRLIHMQTSQIRQWNQSIGGSESYICNVPVSVQTLSWMKGWARAWLIDRRFAGSKTRIFSRKSFSCPTLRSWSSGIRWPPTMSAIRSLLGLIVLITVTFSYRQQHATHLQCCLVCPFELQKTRPGEKIIVRYNTMDYINVRRKAVEQPA